MNKIILALAYASMLLFSLSAWSASTKEEILELRIQVTEIQKDLAEIKKLLEDGARALAEDVNDALDDSELRVDLGNEEGDGDSRVQVSTRDVSRGEDEHHDRQTELKSNQP